MICPSCGRSVPDGSRYCSGCGIDLSRLKNGIFCQKCGAKLSPSKSICPLCGTPVKENVRKQSEDRNAGKNPPEADLKRSSSGSAPNGARSATSSRPSSASKTASENNTAGKWEFIDDNNSGSSSSRSRNGSNFQNSSSRKTYTFSHTDVKSGGGSPLPEDFLTGLKSNGIDIADI